MSVKLVQTTLSKLVSVLTLGDMQNTIPKPTNGVSFLIRLIKPFLIPEFTLAPSDAKKTPFFNRCSSPSSENAFFSALNMLFASSEGGFLREKNEIVRLDVSR